MNEENHSLNFERLQHAHTSVRAARNLRDYASTMLESEQAKERCAEVQTTAMSHVAQGKLAEKFGDMTERERQIAKDFTWYVTYGRADK